MMKTFLALHLMLLWALNAASPILTPNGTVYIMNGGSLTLTCKIDQDAAFVNLIRNGYTNLVITNTSACSFRKSNSLDTYNYSVTCDQQRKFTMVKHKVNSSDYNTTWSCQIYSLNHADLGTSLVVKVLMHVPVGSVTLMNGSTLTLIENQSAVLVCETNACRPSAAIYWMKDGENITDYPTNVTAVSVDSDLFVSIGTLTYTGQRGDNMKILTCGAYNGLDSVQTSVNLTVTIYYPPSIQGLASPYKVIENQPLNVTCVVSSNPPADQIFWSPSGEGPVSSTLYFRSVSRTKSGTYNCTAQNTMIPTVGTQRNGTITSHIQVDVLYGAGIVNLSVQEGNTVNENSSAIFQCHVDSNPPSTITWMKENSSTVLKTESGVVQSQYRIESAECLNMGNYTCSAYNGYLTTAKERLELFVRCHPRTDFRLTLQTKIYRKHHEAAILRYTVISYPPPRFNWTFLGNGNVSRGLPVSASQHDNGQQSELRLTSLGIDDFGNYTVIADNSLSPPAREVFEIIPADKTECGLEFGLGLVPAFGILCLFIVVAVIFKRKGYKDAYTLGLVLGQGLSIIFIVCCVIIAILISTGTTSCKLEFGLGLVLGSGIPCLIAFIIAVIFIFDSVPSFKGNPERVQLGIGILRGLIFTPVIYIIVERLLYYKRKQESTYYKRKRESTCDKPEEAPLYPPGREPDNKPQEPADSIIKQEPTCREPDNKPQEPADKEVCVELTDNNSGTGKPVEGSEYADEK